VFTALEAWPHREVCTMVQFLWVKHISPVEIYGQLSAACQKMMHRLRKWLKGQPWWWLCLSVEDNMDGCEGTMSCRTYFGKPLSQNSKLGGHRFHSNEEVEMAICELLQRQEHDSVTM